MRRFLRNETGEWRTGWRIVAMFALLVAVLFIINKGWRASGLPRGPDESAWFFALFAALVTGSTLGMLFMLLRFFEGRGLYAIGLSWRRRAWLETIGGTVLGALPVCLLVGLAVVGGYGTVTSSGISATGLMSALLPLAMAGFLLAGWEELVLRGYLLRQFSLGINGTAAVIITAVLFGLAHMGNPGASWQGVLYTVIGGALMGWLMLRSGSLWLLIGYHFGWNAAGSGLFGLEVSGFEREASLLVTTLSGTDWLTGGDYGYEASLPAVVFEVIVLSIALRLTPLNRSAFERD